MNNIDLRCAVEGILFASGKPISAEKVAGALELEKSEAEKILDRFLNEYNKEAHGTKIIRIKDEYQMCTRSEYAEYIARALDNRKNFGLSAAAMEILAITAYNQPVTRAYLEQIRGVDCSSIVNNLVEKGLMERKGHLDAPGRPGLYFVTREFFRCFNISSVDDLPSINDDDLKKIADEDDAQIKMDILETDEQVENND